MRLLENGADRSAPESDSSQRAQGRFEKMPVSGRTLACYLNGDLLASSHDPYAELRWDGERDQRRVFPPFAHRHEKASCVLLGPIAQRSLTGYDALRAAFGGWIRRLVGKDKGRMT